MNECIINFGVFNWWAVLVAAIVGYALGALWYSPLLFGKKWMEFQNLKEEDLQNSWTKAMIITFVTTFLTSFALEAIIVTLEIAFWGHAITISILIGLFVYCGNLLSDYLYSGKPIKLFWIVGMYRFVMILIMSLILTLWQ